MPQYRLPRSVLSPWLEWSFHAALALSSIQRQCFFSIQCFWVPVQGPKSQVKSFDFEPGHQYRLGGTVSMRNRPRIAVSVKQRTSGLDRRGRRNVGYTVSRPKLKCDSREREILVFLKAQIIWQYRVYRMCRHRTSLICLNVKTGFCSTARQPA